jgi:[histone H3]-lysine36 N-dimethyltransferase SETMAR
VALAVLGLPLLDHPPYSPDLAPFDFAIFPDLKLKLKGQKFGSIAELQTTTNVLLRALPREYFEDVFFQQWPKRHQRCVEYRGSYFEKK